MQLDQDSDVTDTAEVDDFICRINDAQKFFSDFRILTWFCGCVWFGWSHNKPYLQGRGRHIVGRLDHCCL